MEFVEAMKAKSELCNSILRNGSCVKCPLFNDNNGHLVTCGTLIEKYPEDAEKILIKYREEHPVKTKLDIMMERFPELSEEYIIDKLCCKSMFATDVDHCGKCHTVCRECWDSIFEGFVDTVNSSDSTRVCTHNNEDTHKKPVVGESLSKKMKTSYNEFYNK